MYVPVSMQQTSRHTYTVPVSFFLHGILYRMHKLTQINTHAHTHTRTLHFPSAMLQRRTMKSEHVVFHCFALSSAVCCTSFPFLCHCRCHCCCCNIFWLHLNFAIHCAEKKSLCGCFKRAPRNHRIMFGSLMRSTIDIWEFAQMYRASDWSCFVVFNFSFTFDYLFVNELHALLFIFAQKRNFSKETKYDHHR